MPKIDSWAPIFTQAKAPEDSVAWALCGWTTEVLYQYPGESKKSYRHAHFLADTIQLPPSAIQDLWEYTFRRTHHQILEKGFQEDFKKKLLQSHGEEVIPPEIWEGQEPAITIGSEMSISERSEEVQASQLAGDL